MKLARMPDGEPEIFHTIQGEGRNAGMPSVFIRASLCNLHCFWCDTDYTWNWDDTSHSHANHTKYRREDSILDLEIPALVEFLTRFKCSNYVFTGGEPLLQERAWVNLMKAITSELGESHFEIETNGTLAPGDEFLDLIDQINVSPKLSNSRVDSSKRIVGENLQVLAKTDIADFKFVLENHSDWSEVAEMIDRFDLDTSRVFLMPKASTLEELTELQGRIAEIARAHNCRYSDRLHLRLFGAKRGV